MTRTLVTGGSGFIGHYLVSELLARGRQVRVLDIGLPARAWPTVDYVKGSVLNREIVREAMSGVEEVFHLAALPGMWKPDRGAFHAVNFGGTENLLDAARQRGIARFVHCSTESILFRTSRSGTAAAEGELPAVAEMPGPYTRSKMLADRLALQAAASGLPVIIGCPTMPIGPHDHNLTPPTAMILHFLKRGPLQMYLDFTVNIVDVRDVAVGLVLAMEKGQVGHRYILGSDSIRLSGILTLMKAMSGQRKLFIPVPGPLAELAASMIELKANHLTRRAPSATVEAVRIARRAKLLSIGKARAELGYAPRPVEPVLRETIAHLMDAPMSRVLRHA